MFSKHTFSSAMKTFTRAQEELTAAKESNDAELAEVEARLEDCQKEGANIARVQAFFNNLLGTKA